MRFRVEVGLLILSLAFVVFFFGGLNVHIGLAESWRLVVILEANPHRYLSYILDAILYLILPPAIGLAFNIIAFIRERKSPIGVFEWWLPLAVFGGFFFFWGAFGLRRMYTHYIDAIQEANAFSFVDITNSILAVYVTASVGYIIWLFSGVLFMLSPVFKMMLLNKGKVVKARKVK